MEVEACTNYHPDSNGVCVVRQAVVVCRATPLQKAQVVELVKENRQVWTLKPQTATRVLGRGGVMAIKRARCVPASPDPCLSICPRAGADLGYRGWGK